MNETPLFDSIHTALTVVPVARRHSTATRDKDDFVSLLREVDPGPAKTLDVDLKRLRTCEAIQHVPIIGVCGMMNSGKSSLVAHFLSDEGRKRTLIGDFREEGTHRFVLWVPKSWSSDPIRRTELGAFLKGTFDTNLEELSSDPDDAARQYNARSERTIEFGVPLLAFDPELDSHGLALLDCPDIQRSHDTAKKEKTAEIRKQALARATRLCSAFIVVSSAKQQEDEDLKDVFDALNSGISSLPVYYVSTMVNPIQMDSVNQDVEKRLVELGVHDRVRRKFGSPQLVGVPPSGYPKGVEYKDLAGELEDIRLICGELEPSELQRGFVDDLIKKLRSSFHSGRDRIMEHQRANQNIIHQGRGELMKFLDNTFSRSGKGLSPLYSKEVVGLLMGSIAKTAPWYLQPSFWVAGSFKWMMEGLGSGWDWVTNQLSAFKLKSDKEGAIKDPKHLGTVTPQQFSLCFLGKNWIPADTSEATLIKVWNLSINTIAREDSLIDTETMRLDLDKKMSTIWNSVGFWNKFWATASLPLVLAGGFAVILFAPLDLGGTAVLYAASMSEIMLALGLGVATGTASSLALDRAVEQHAARPQHSALFAMLQDRMGIPRASLQELCGMPENRDLQLTDSKVGAKEVLIHTLAEPIVRVDSESLRRIEMTITGVGD